MEIEIHILSFVQAYVCARHWKPDRTTLPKLNQLPQNVGQIVVDGISVNSSYSTDVQVILKCKSKSGLVVGSNLNGVKAMPWSILVHSKNEKKENIGSQIGHTKKKH